MMYILTSKVENNFDLDLVYLDFAKPFDSVPHGKLHKSEKDGGSGNLSNWIKKSLSNQRLRVRIDSELPSWESVISGAQQGSVLGPILFIILINDIPSDIRGKLLLFADDTKLLEILLSIISNQELQNDINQLSECFDKWQLKFNTTKCKVINSGPNKSTAYAMLDLNDDKIKRLEFIDEEKDIGVFTDNKLRFSTHLISQMKKTSRKMGLIRRSYTNLDKDSFRYLFN